MNPRYPIFIPTKGRCEYRYTAKVFDCLGVEYREVVEEDDAENYRKAGSKRLLVMPQHDKGLVVTRNWIWDYADMLGVKRFWTFDDNIKRLFRFNHNLQVPVASPEPLVAIEDFVERYTNVPIAGMNYVMAIRRKDRRVMPFSLNTRVYSNMLILTDARGSNGKRFRNEGFYNDDTDLCLRVLKDGFCTILFNAFLIEKTTTMACEGGMTPHYQGDGRYKMAAELAAKHPDVVKIGRRWNRWQHIVDYRPFRGNRLLKQADFETPEGHNEYGMRLVKVGGG